MTPRLLLVLSENWTMTSPRDLRALVRIAAATERLRLVAGAIIAPLRVLRASRRAKTVPHRVSAGEARLHLAKVSQSLWV